jgi:hypothetical protein
MTLPILKARTIIHEFYLESKNKNPLEGTSEKIHRAHVAKKIHDLSFNKEKCDSYIYILNLLDFLETISFYVNHGDIEDSDIENLMGLSLTFFYDIFSARIDERRVKYSNPNYYCEFEKLVNRIKCEKTLGS